MTGLPGGGGGVAGPLGLQASARPPPGGPQQLHGDEGAGCGQRKGGRGGEGPLREERGRLLQRRGSRALGKEVKNTIGPL